MSYLLLLHVLDAMTNGIVFVVVMDCLNLCIHIKSVEREREHMFLLHTSCLLYRLKMNWMKSAPKFSRNWRANCRTLSLIFLFHVWQTTSRTTLTYFRFWAASQQCSAILLSTVNIFSFALSSYLYLFCFPCQYFASVMKYSLLCPLQGGLQMKRLIFLSLESCKC